MDGYSELLLEIRVTALVSAVRIALWVVSLRRIQGFADFLTAEVREQNTFPGVERLSRAVSTASRYVPHATCLTQAVALHYLLKRNGLKSRLRIGVAKNNGAFESHAWVENQGRIVLGDIGLQYTPILEWE